MTWRFLLAPTRRKRASLSAAISWSGRIFSTARNSASGRKSASGNQFVQALMQLLLVRTLGQMTQSVCGISRGNNRDQKSARRLDDMRKSNRTHRLRAEPAIDLADWRACATILRRSAPLDFSTSSSRRKEIEVQSSEPVAEIAIPAGRGSQLQRRDPEPAASCATDRARLLGPRL